MISFSVPHVSVHKDDSRKTALRHFSRALFLSLLFLSGCVGNAGNIEKERISLGSQPFSPDGKYILLSIHENDRINIWRINRDGSGLTRLTSGPEDNFDASYSPDGSKIVFSSTEGVERTVPIRSIEPTLYKDLQRANLYLMDSDGSSKVCLTSGPGQHTSPVFSPDGQRIYFRFSRSFTDAYSPKSESFWADSDIYAINVDGSNPIAVTNKRFSCLSPPSVAPDGKRILMYALIAYESYYFEEGFWEFPIDHPEEKKFIAPNYLAEFTEPRSTYSRSRKPFGNGDLFNPRFSPDKKLMLFKVWNLDVRLKGVGARRGNGIGVMDLESKDTKILARHAVIMGSIFSRWKGDSLRLRSNGFLQCI